MSKKYGLHSSGKSQRIFSGNFVVSVLWLLLFLFGFVIVKLRNLLQIQIMGAVPDNRINHKNYNFLNHIQSFSLSQPI